MWTNLWLEKKTENDNGLKVSVEWGLPGDVTENERLKNALQELQHSPAMKAVGSVTLRALYDEELGAEGYRIVPDQKGGYFVDASSDTGILFGVFRLIALIRLNGKLEAPYTEVPKNPLRMLNHWDNMDGDIERGYSGRSFFFDNDEILINERTVDYARFLCSIGINGVVINNVNVHKAACDLINERYIHKVRELSDLFSSYGVKLFLSLNYASPIEDENVKSADPLDPKVIAWWEAKMKEIYSVIPDFAGFLVKADSEGRPGPFTYGRNQAEGANLLARAIRPYGGIIIWRCFVYNCQQDWRDLKTDRARAAYDYFKDLDGQFDDNVILQIKNGPMDFQIREPVSPLFGGLKDTNQMIEFQIAQEYTGQQRHVCYLIPWFKEVLDFDTYQKTPDGSDSKVKELVSGKSRKLPYAGMCAVTNTGNDENWTGHDLAAANLYGFGRLAFDPELTSEEIAEEWIRLTFGDDTVVIKNILKILMMSWPAYEKYSAPLGIGWMVSPNYHYGPDPDGYEYSRWGTYHRADHLGIGVERSTEGTGYASLYNEPLASMYEKPETTPDELLLFFHHMPYDYVLKSGKTIIQHIYDTHFEGAEDVEEMNRLLLELKGKIDEAAFERMRSRFEHQVAHSKEWRDVINSYFWRKTLIPDEKGRPLY